MMWSISSHNMMRRCQRQFFFAHIMASHNAKDADRKEAHLLKQLQHTPQWQGSIIHKVLELYFVPALLAKKSINVPFLLQAAREMAQRQFQFSQTAMYRGSDLTKTAAGNDYCVLFDHEYEHQITPSMLSDVDAVFEVCFTNLSQQSDLLSYLAQGRNYEVECLYKFNMEDAQVQAKIDLLFWRDDTHPVVVDWKVSASDTSNYKRQLAVYALAVINNFKKRAIPAENIDLIEVNLLENKVRHHSFSTAELEEAEAFVYNSISDMQALRGNEDFKGQDIDAFEITENGTTCLHCNFFRLCARYLAPAQEPATESKGQLTLL